jgi:hypothetical protein
MYCNNNNKIKQCPSITNNITPYNTVTNNNNKSTTTTTTATEQQQQTTTTISTNNEHTTNIPTIVSPNK